MFKPIPVTKKLLEEDVETAVCRYARSKGFKAEKFTSPNRRSVPDRIISGAGRKLFYIEFKRPGGKPTKAQARDHAERRALGFEVYVVDDIAEGKNIIDLWSQK